MKILYLDDDIVVAVKPPRVLSTDEPGGLPGLVRQALGDESADVRTVHRLDRVVSGLMVLARNAKSAAELSRQIREDLFQKEYLAVVHGCPEMPAGEFRDLLFRNKQERKTYVVPEPAKGVQEAILTYQVLNSAENLSRVKIRLITGRTHQIRAQFSSRKLPLVGDRKYSLLEDACEIALWSHFLGFAHPTTGEKMTFTLEPPEIYPWTEC
ncbi:MAG: RluA family pseudouridine synthase [Oscillospiraceae bacterium]|nr:RluA family pseudouridine synthase [Oscillospiraceae bacterium]